MDLASSFESLGISLALGLLVGLQRERVARHIAGIRTFPLISLMGTLSAMLAQEYGGWIVAAALFAVISATVIGNLADLQGGQAHHGITTEVAMVVMFLVGALVWHGSWTVAVVVGAGVAILLHAKPMLHGFAERLADKDIRAIMQFALITLVILPILPNRTWGDRPFDVLNPRHIWLMVVLVVGIRLGGYVAYKLVGARAGILLGGLLGGLVSSTATTVSYSRRMRDAGNGNGSGSDATLAAATVIVVASTVTYGRILLEVGVVAPSSLRLLAGPFVTAGAASAALAVIVWLVCARKFADLPEQDNPTELRSSIFFGVLYAIVLLAVAAAKHYFSDRGLYAVAAVSGLTDMNAITLSTARILDDGLIEPALAWRLILVASIFNDLFKIVLVGILGGRRLLRLVALLFAVKIGIGAAVFVVWPMLGAAP